MGLGLLAFAPTKNRSSFVSDVHTNFCYSTFQELRNYILQLTADYIVTLSREDEKTKNLERSGEKDEGGDVFFDGEEFSYFDKKILKEMRRLLLSCIEQKKKLVVAGREVGEEISSRIDYRKFGELIKEHEPIFYELCLSGLIWFIDHSDCDGFWTPGQVSDIAFLFENLGIMKVDKEAEKSLLYSQKECAIRFKHFIDQANYYGASVMFC